LTLDYNYIDSKALEFLAKVIVQARQLKILSLANCRIKGEDLDKFVAVGMANSQSLVFLDLSRNQLG
jgi:Ran GTPase-activating protein (RanGAP) involved in mRNA processing and transport